MGGSKDQKATNKMATSMYDANTASQNQFEAESRKRGDESYGRSTGAYNDTYSGYKDYADAGGQKWLDAAGFGSGGSGGGGGDAGAGDPRFGDVESSYRNFMGGGGVDTGMFDKFQGKLMGMAENGGWDQTARDNVNKSISGFQNFADTGGISAEDQARMRGGGVYDEFAKTGGLSAADRADITARGNSVIPSFYSGMKDEAARLGRVQGGGGPGQGALMSRMGRDQARGAQEAARDTRLGIQGQVNEGRLAGAAGMSTSEAALQNQLSSNKLSGMRGVYDAQSGMSNSIAQNTIGAANAGAGNETGMQGVIQQGKMFGTSGLEGMAESQAARNAAGSAASSADAKWKANFLAGNSLEGLAGMRGLRTDTPGEDALYSGNRLNSRQIYNSGTGNALNIKGQSDSRPWYETAIQGAGALGGVMTGFGALNRKPKAPAAYNPYQDDGQ